MPNVIRGFAAAAWLATLAAAPAQAQLKLQGLPLPAMPGQGVTQTVSQLGASTIDRLSEVRHLENARLIRDNRRVIDADSYGNPIVRGEVLGTGMTEDALIRAKTLNFAVAREQSIDMLALHLVVLGAPEGMSTKQALSLLRTADPDGVYDYNHVYSGSGAALSASVAERPSPERAALHPARSSTRIGLIDTGVDSNHPAFKASSIEIWGCGGRFVPAAHGTAVASLLVGASDGFRGVQPDAQLFAADVYCGSPTGGAVDALTAGFGWLLEQQVLVINVSLVGPKNALLERVVAALVAKGVVIVAAVGNDGPAAPPLYPASYPHVVGVTGVDARRRVLIEAARGPQVMFASPGADLAAASGVDAYSAVRGTSFAAPIVAGMLAQALSGSEPGNLDESKGAIAALAQSAVDLGPPGRDTTYGFGLVGAEYRIDPSALLHRQKNK